MWHVSYHLYQGWTTSMRPKGTFFTVLPQKGTKVVRLFTFSDLVLAFQRFTSVSIVCRCKDWWCV